MRLALFLALFALAACQTSTETDVSVTDPAHAPPAEIAAGGPATGGPATGGPNVTISAAGFQPASVTVPAGEATTLGFTREADAPCDGPLTGDDGLGMAPTTLEAGQRAEVTVTPEPGVYQVACVETGAALIVEAN